MLIARLPYSDLLLHSFFIHYIMVALMTETRDIEDGIIPP